MALARMATAQQRRSGMEMDMEMAFELQMEEAIAASMRQANRGELDGIGPQAGSRQAEADAARGGDSSGPPVLQSDAEHGVAVIDGGEDDDDGDGDGGSPFHRDQVFGIQVRAIKTPEGHVGTGVLLTQPGLEARVLWSQSRYAGQGLSWHVAEYGGLLDAMEVAERLGVQHLCVRVSSRLVSDQVNGFWKPKLANQWRLLNQVREAMLSFPSFEIDPWPKGTSSDAVNELAQAALAHLVAGDASSSYSGASTSGAIGIVAQQSGPSSASTSTDPSTSRRVNKVNCLICLEDKSSLEMATVKKCQHKFCVTCMQQHAEVQVKASQVPVRCPQAGCPEMLEYPEECKKYLTHEVFGILTKRLAEASVPEADRVYCPYANCSTLMDKSGLNLPEQGTSSAASSSLFQKVECVKCARGFCLDCRVPWHWNRSCQEYQNLPPDQRDAEESNLYKLAQNQKWQRCKKCRRMIELAEGCYHMTCRCGYEFCYTCGAEWKHKKQQCECKLWDERNIVRTPLDSDDDSDSDDDDDDMYDFVEDDDDDVDDDHMIDEEIFGYVVGADDIDELDYDDYFNDGDSLIGLEELVHGFGEMRGVDQMLDRMIFETPAPPFQNPFYKTKLCRYFPRPGGCKAGILCRFAHGDHELRHP